MIDQSRRTAREGLDPSVYDKAVANLKDGETPDLVVEMKQTRNELLAVMAALPANQRDAFTLVKLEGLTQLQAAEVLGVTVTAVKLRVFRAIHALRAVGWRGHRL